MKMRGFSFSVFLVLALIAMIINLVVGDSVHINANVKKQSPSVHGNAIRNFSPSGKQTDADTSTPATSPTPPTLIPKTNKTHSQQHSQQQQQQQQQHHARNSTHRGYFVITIIIIASILTVSTIIYYRRYQDDSDSISHPSALQEAPTTPPQPPPTVKTPEWTPYPNGGGYVSIAETPRRTSGLLNSGATPCSVRKDRFLRDDVRMGSLGSGSIGGDLRFANNVVSSWSTESRREETVEGRLTRDDDGLGLRYVGQKSPNPLHYNSSVSSDKVDRVDRNKTATNVFDSLAGKTSSSLVETSPFLVSATSSTMSQRSTDSNEFNVASSFNTPPTPPMTPSTPENTLASPFSSPLSPPTSPKVAVSTTPTPSAPAVVLTVTCSSKDSLENTLPSPALSSGSLYEYPQHVTSPNVAFNRLSLSEVLSRTTSNDSQKFGFRTLPAVAGAFSPGAPKVNIPSYFFEQGSLVPGVSSDRNGVKAESRNAARDLKMERVYQVLNRFEERKKESVCREDNMRTALKLVAKVERVEEHCRFRLIDQVRKVAEMESNLRPTKPRNFRQHDQRQPVKNKVKLLQAENRAVRLEANLRRAQVARERVVEKRRKTNVGSRRYSSPAFTTCYARGVSGFGQSILHWKHLSGQYGIEKDPEFVKQVELMWKKVFQHKKINIDMSAMIDIEEFNITALYDDNGEVLGAIAYQILKSCVYVDLLGVDGAHRGRNIGVALLNRMKEIGITRKRPVLLFSLGGVEVWYESQGFELSSEITKLPCYGTSGDFMIWYPPDSMEFYDHTINATAPTQQNTNVKNQSQSNHCKNRPAPSRDPDKPKPTPQRDRGRPQNKSKSTPVNTVNSTKSKVKDGERCDGKKSFEAGVENTSVSTAAVGQAPTVMLTPQAVLPPNNVVDVLAQHANPAPRIRTAVLDTVAEATFYIQLPLVATKLESVSSAAQEKRSLKPAVRVSNQNSRPHAWERPHDASYKNPPTLSPVLKTLVSSPIGTARLDDDNQQQQQQQEPIVMSLVQRQQYSAPTLEAAQSQPLPVVAYLNNVVSNVGEQPTVISSPSKTTEPEPEPMLVDQDSVVSIKIEASKRGVAMASMASLFLSTLCYTKKLDEQTIVPSKSYWTTINKKKECKQAKVAEIKAKAAVRAAGAARRSRLVKEQYDEMLLQHHQQQQRAAIVSSTRGASRD
ncbi:hypothetical protein HDU76_012575 [Blyttiomyces sp. JEL0837]|nr:hypothetical protein HDU76_012575 [Blyttiomyces sp. JEL0837]